MTPSTLKHLNLTQWPFSITATTEQAETWVGRPAFAKKLKAIQRSASRVAASQIIPLWATFGSGKTHALLHLRWLAEQDPGLLPIYVVVPQGVRSFNDLYQAIVDAALEQRCLDQAGRRLLQKRGTVDGDLAEALRLIGGQASAIGLQTAQSWLRGEKVPMRALRDVGISRRIETVPDAVHALDQLLTALKEGGERTVLLLIDEMQSLELLGKKLAEATGGLHKVFDRQQENLLMVLSFTTGSQSSLRPILGGAIYNRATLPPLTLPPLDRKDAVELITGLLAQAALEPARAPFPFEPEAITAVVRALEDGGVELTARNVIKAFDGVLRAADLAIEDEEIDAVDAAFALESLESAS